MEQTQKRPVVMKINMPFCSHQCSFCPKKVTPGRDSHLIHQYVMALALELKANAEEFADCRVKAIRLGGGCASIMSGSDLDHLMRLIRLSYHVDEDAPITMRTAPSDINGANMPFYNRSHITRYDLEMISLEPEDFIHLDYLNYKEQLPYISSGFLRASSRPVMGFVLLYGKRTISKWGFRRSILETVRRPVCHVLLQKCAGEDVLDEASCQAQLAEAAKILEEHGFREYLPGRWAKEGSEDRFWQEEAGGTEVIAFGLGAKTVFDGAMTVNTGDMETYLKHSDQFDKITVEARPLNM